MEAVILGLLGVFTGAYLTSLRERQSNARQKLEELGERLHALAQWLRLNSEDLQTRGVVDSTEAFNRPLVLAYYYSYTVYQPMNALIHAASVMHKGEATLGECTALLSSASTACLREFKHRFSLPFWHWRRILFWWETRRSRLYALGD